MFFFFFNEDFRYELENFRSNPKLNAECKRARNQINEFRLRFPLERLGYLQPEEYISENNRQRDDFYSWISDKTKDVAGSLAWAKHKLGEIGTRSNTYAGNQSGQFDFTKRPSQQNFSEAIHNCLIPFLRSRGHDCLWEAEKAFGKPLLLKLLYLYYPEEYVGIARVGWVERIVDGFSLDYGVTVYDRSQAVERFIAEQESSCRHGERLGSPAIRAFFDDYIGFSSESKPFVAYLKGVEGFSDELAEKFARHARSFSRLLSGYRLIKRSLFKSTGAEVREQGRLFLFEYASKSALSNQKKADFSNVIDVYSTYFSKVVGNEKLHEYFVPSDYSLAGRSTGKLENRTQRKSGGRLNKKKVVDWKIKFSDAITSLDVTRILEEAAKDRLYFRHYTTLSSFMYMTEEADKWMFRLTRGDDSNMNDQLEFKYLGDAKTWKRTYIGSFSCVEDESVAMWGLYGKPMNEALRLSFGRDAMQKWLDALHYQEGQCPEAQFFGSNGVEGDKIQLRWADIEFHFADVLYGGCVNPNESSVGSYMFRRKRLSKELFARFGPRFEQTPDITGFIKSMDWAYEEETRIIVRVSENVALPKGMAASDIQYIFIPIPKDVLAMVEYMKGPCVPKKLRPVMDEQIARIIGPKARLSDSKYKGSLKFK